MCEKITLISLLLKVLLWSLEDVCVCQARRISYNVSLVSLPTFWKCNPLSIE